MARKEKRSFERLEQQIRVHVSTEGQKAQVLRTNNISDQGFYARKIKGLKVKKDTELKLVFITSQGNVDYLHWRQGVVRHVHNHGMGVKLKPLVTSE